MPFDEQEKGEELMNSLVGAIWAEQILSKLMAQSVFIVHACQYSAFVWCFLVQNQRRSEG